MAKAENKTEPLPVALSPDSSRPDIAFVRDKISVAAVARELGLYVSGTGKVARCWRQEGHSHGDQDPSIRFHRKKNKGRCFICDPRMWSNIDLVMMVRQCEMLPAVLWIAERFPVPSLPKGAHVRRREGWCPRYHSGVEENVITLLVRSGIWADLSSAEARILPAFITFMNRDTGLCEISYRGLMRFSGIGSSATISEALKHFRQLGILEIYRAKGMMGTSGVSRYRLTPENPQFQTLIAETFRRQREEIRVERELRERQRKERQSQRATCKGNSLFTR